MQATFVSQLEPPSRADTIPQAPNLDLHSPFSSGSLPCIDLSDHGLDVPALLDRLRFLLDRPEHEAYAALAERDSGTSTVLDVLRDVCTLVSALAADRAQPYSSNLPTIVELLRRFIVIVEDRRCALGPPVAVADGVLVLADLKYLLANSLLLLHGTCEPADCFGWRTAGLRPDPVKMLEAERLLEEACQLHVPAQTALGLTTRSFWHRDMFGGGTGTPEPTSPTSLANSVPFSRVMARAAIVNACIAKNHERAILEQERAQAYDSDEQLIADEVRRKRKRGLDLLKHISEMEHCIPQYVNRSSAVQASHRHSVTFSHLCLANYYTECGNLSSALYHSKTAITAKSHYERDVRGLHDWEIDALWEDKCVYTGQFSPPICYKLPPGVTDQLFVDGLCEKAASMESHAEAMAELSRAMEHATAVQGKSGMMLLEPSLQLLRRMIASKCISCRGYGQAVKLCGVVVKLARWHSYKLPTAQALNWLERAEACMVPACVAEEHWYQALEHQKALLAIKLQAHGQFSRSVLCARPWLVGLYAVKMYQAEQLQHPRLGSPCLARRSPAMPPNLAYHTTAALKQLEHHLSQGVMLLAAHLLLYVQALQRTEKRDFGRSKSAPQPPARELSLRASVPLSVASIDSNSTYGSTRSTTQMFWHNAPALAHLSMPPQRPTAESIAPAAAERFEQTAPARMEAAAERAVAEVCGEEEGHDVAHWAATGHASTLGAATRCDDANCECAGSGEREAAQGPAKRKCHNTAHTTPFSAASANPDLRSFPIAEDPAREETELREYFCISNASDDGSRVPTSDLKRSSPSSSSHSAASSPRKQLVSMMQLPPGYITDDALRQLRSTPLDELLQRLEDVEARLTVAVGPVSCTPFSSCAAYKLPRPDWFDEIFSSHWALTLEMLSKHVPAADTVPLARVLAAARRLDAMMDPITTAAVESDDLEPFPAGELLRMACSHDGEWLDASLNSLQVDEVTDLPAAVLPADALPISSPPTKQTDTELGTNYTSAGSSAEPGSSGAAVPRSDAPWAGNTDPVAPQHFRDTGVAAPFGAPPPPELGHVSPFSGTSSDDAPHDSSAGVDATSTAPCTSDDQQPSAEGSARQRPRGEHYGEAQDTVMDAPFSAGPPNLQAGGSGESGTQHFGGSDSPRKMIHCARERLSALDINDGGSFAAPPPAQSDGSPPAWPVRAPDVGSSFGGAPPSAAGGAAFGSANMSTGGSSSSSSLAASLPSMSTHGSVSSIDNFVAGDGFGMLGPPAGSFGLRPDASIVADCATDADHDAFGSMAFGHDDATSDLEDAETPPALRSGRSMPAAGCFAVDLPPRQEADTAVDAFLGTHELARSTTAPLQTTACSPFGRDASAVTYAAAPSPPALAEPAPSARVDSAPTPGRVTFSPVTVQIEPPAPARDSELCYSRSFMRASSYTTAAAPLAKDSFMRASSYGNAAAAASADDALPAHLRRHAPVAAPLGSAGAGTDSSRAPGSPTHAMSFNSMSAPSNAIQVGQPFWGPRRPPLSQPPDDAGNLQSSMKAHTLAAPLDALFDDDFFP